MYGERSFFPMLGVGVFYIMFWIGFVVGHNFGLACDAILLTGLIFGAAGSYGIVKLESLSKGERRRSRQASKVKPTSDRLQHATKPVLQA